jgi:penicillin amidase
MKFLRYTGIFVLLLLVFAIVFIKVLPMRSVPKYEGNFKLPGLENEVTVYYDSLVIPHIYAETEADLYKTVGYIMAQERLWQMDLLRRVTLGRLSEIFGEDYVKTDLLLRSLRNSEKSFQILDSLDQEVKLSLYAFADGINYYISENKKKLPVEFSILGYKPEPWEPHHSLNLIGYMAWDLKAGWGQFIMQKLKTTLDSALFYDLMPDIEARKSVIAPNYKIDSINFSSSLLSYDDRLEEMGADIFSASNNWAVNAKKSTTGNPILANDMHLGYTLPGIWMQMHQVVKGKLNVTGVALPGQPLIIAGHNESIAWGMTNTYVDNVDFYQEKVNKDTTQYLFNSNWNDIITKTEKIATSEGDTIELINRFTHRGPIVSEHKGFDDNVISMHWAGENFSNEMRTVYLLNRAKNWDEFKNAVKSFKAISQNINYADIDGNIGIYACAGIPIRKREFAKFLFPV